MNWTQEDLDRRNREVLGVGTSPAPAEPDASVAWPEYMIEAECTRLLEQDGWRALRTDPVSDRGRGKGFGELGMADALFLRECSPTAERAGLQPPWGQILWVEFKAGRATAKKHQVEWHRNERARGFRTWIANEDFPATVEGFREHYAASGLMRRKRWW